MDQIEYGMRRVAWGLPGENGRRKECSSKRQVASILLRGRFGGWMHTVLRNFVDAARGRFLMEAEKLIHRARAFADGVGLVDRAGDVRFCQDHRFAQLLSGSELRRDGG